MTAVTTEHGTYGWHRHKECRCLPGDDRAAATVGRGGLKAPARDV